MPFIQLPLTIADFEERAAAVLEQGPYGYFAGGAGDEVTVEDNVRAWRRIAIRPRVLVDVSERDPSTTLLGRPRPHPVVVAPTAYHRLAHPDGEEATARGAATAESIFCLSSLATARPADVAAAAPDGTRWFQLYVFKDRAVSHELLQAATESGYEAIVITVDMPVLGIRERDVRSQYVIPDALASPGVGAKERSGAMSLLQIGDLIDASLTWSDVEEFASSCDLPVLVKGVLTPEDARLAAEHGAAGVVVSNHGGRQLDTVATGTEALPAVVEAVGDRMDVIVDGGIRRGTDVLKALALGARAVMVGRPVIWGLAVDGEDGVRAVLELILAEFDVALALSGVPQASALGPTCVEIQGSD
ncbi:MAG TPA: alpha-hydroxy acid oxidase [Solirubrobacterales bacterium]|nr:alpha-hydroxy acid oxidase [Solirubrobacterales bacterium]